MHTMFLKFVFRVCVTAEQDAAVSAAKAKQNELSQKCKTLESKIKDAKAHREKELKTAEQEVTKAKKKAEESNKTMKAKQQVISSKKLNSCQVGEICCIT